MEHPVLRDYADITVIWRSAGRCGGDFRCLLGGVRPGRQPVKHAVLTARLNMAYKIISCPQRTKAVILSSQLNVSANEPQGDTDMGNLPVEHV